MVVLLRRRETGLYAAAFAAVLIFLNGGLIDVGELSRSQIPFAWTDDLARAAIAVSLGLGAGLLAASTARLLAPNLRQ